MSGTLPNGVSMGFIAIPEIPCFCSRFVFTVLTHQNFSPSKWKWNTLLKFVSPSVWDYKFLDFLCFASSPINWPEAAQSVFPMDFAIIGDCWDSPFFCSRFVFGRLTKDHQCLPQDNPFQWWIWLSPSIRRMDVYFLSWTLVCRSVELDQI